MGLDLLPGIIASGFLGLVMGNFATNPIYRLPRNDSLFLRDPYCGDCGAQLQPKDLFPVLSWLSTRGKCRYCGAPVPGTYALFEALCGLMFVFCYMQFGFSELFLLITLGMTALLMMMMMLILDNFFSDRTLIACIVFGMLARTLNDHTIYNFAGSAYAGLLVGAVAWKLSKVPMKRDAAAFPPYLKLLVAAGIWLSLSQMAALCVGLLLTLPLRKGKPFLAEYVIIVTTAALVLTRISL